MTEILHSQMVNATFWLAPNARLLQTQCAWCDMHTMPHKGRSCGMAADMADCMHQIRQAR